MFKQYKLKNYKFILIALVVILNTIGVALVGSASPGGQKKRIIGMVSLCFWYPILIIILYCVFPG